MNAVIKGYFKELMNQKSDDYVFFELKRMKIMWWINETNCAEDFESMGLNMLQKKKRVKFIKKYDQKAWKRCHVEDLFVILSQFKQKETSN